MAVIWADSFDYFGVGGSASPALINLGLNGYTAQGLALSGATTLSIVEDGTARTGLRHLVSSDTGTTNSGLLSRLLDAPLNTLVIGCAINVISANTNSTWRGIGQRFGVAGNYELYSVVMNPELGVSVYSGNTLLGSSAPNIYVNNAWYWLETKARNNTATGSIGQIEVRLNGETVLVVNLDMPLQFASFSIGRSAESGFITGSAKFDDYVIDDNNFNGDRRCFSSFPSADTALANWVPNTGTIGYDRINEATPDDVNYIQANNAGDISQFEKTAIGIATNDIAAIVVVARALKVDAGPSSFRIGVQSGAVVSNGPIIALGTSPVYYRQIFTKDPNGNIAWTKTNADAAKIRFTREV